MGDKKKEEHEGHKNYYCFEMKLNEWISFFFSLTRMIHQLKCIANGKQQFR